jgi:hypothetical protein
MIMKVHDETHFLLLLRKNVKGSDKANTSYCQGCLASRTTKRLTNIPPHTPIRDKISKFLA